MKYCTTKHKKTRKIKNKIKRFILKSITWVMGIIFLISVCSLDSEPFYIPLAALVVSGGWLWLMAWGNSYTY